MFRVVKYHNVYTKKDELFNTSVEVGYYDGALYNTAKEQYSFYTKLYGMTEIVNTLRYEYRITLVDDDGTVLLNHQTSGYEKIDVPLC